jgi:hypothetical protein
LRGKAKVARYALRRKGTEDAVVQIIFKAKTATAMDIVYEYFIVPETASVYGGKT